MADSKISALPASTTPLAGTEVLPIVQSSATVKVATNDLTVRNIRANATTGILQVTGPANSSTRVATVPNADFTVARTDAAQSFTGDQTLGTGNLIQGTAAKGVNFTANTPAAGMTSQLLNWYEEGTWTPVGVNFTVVGTLTIVGRYIIIGKMITITVTIRATTSTASTANSTYFTGLPVTPLRTGVINVVGNNAITSYGQGLIDTSNLLYTPTWTTGANQTVTLVGTYFLI